MTHISANRAHRHRSPISSPEALLSNTGYLERIGSPRPCRQSVKRVYWSPSMMIPSFVLIGLEILNTIGSLKHTPGNPSKRWGAKPPTFWKGFLGIRGSLDPKNKDLENFAQPGVGYALSCLHNSSGENASRLIVPGLWPRTEIPS